MQYLEGEEEYENAIENAPNDSGVEELEAGEEEVLASILENILIAPRQKIPTQRYVIFKTWCIINGQVCKVLVDSGCTENIISSGVIKALKLNTIKHLEPYNISWVRKGIDILVTEMCNVTLSIENNFMCKVVCDVLDMDVCHLNPRSSLAVRYSCNL